MENKEGTKNIAVGAASLQNSQGTYNVGIGHGAGINITTGTDNICIGRGSATSSATVSGECIIGGDAITTTRLRGNLLYLYGTNADYPNPPLISFSASGVKYNAAGGANSIAFKWGSNVLIARIDNTRDVKLVEGARLAEVEEAFEKKLAIKDKLIEKLSARLDKLEKRIK